MNDTQEESGTGDEESHGHEGESKEKSASPEYIQQLKNDAAKWRLRAKENKESAKKHAESEAQLKEAMAKADDAIRQVGEIKTAAEKRIVDSELRAIATEFGLKKLEYLKLGDINSVTIDENGNVIGAREMMEKLKNNDPDLFKLSTTTNTSFSSGAGAGDKAAVTEKKVLKMSPEEYKKAEADYLRGLS